MIKLEKFCDEVLSQLAMEHMRIIKCTKDTANDPERPADFEAWAGGYLMGLQFCVGAITTLLGEKQDSPASHK